MIVVTSRIRVTHGDADRLAAQYRERLHLADRVPGCHGVEVMRRLEAPAEFMVYSRWESWEAYLSYRAHPAFREAHARIPAGLRVERLDGGTSAYEVLS